MVSRVRTLSKSKLTLGVRNNSPRNRNTLLLAARQEETTFSNIGLVAFGQGRNKVVGVGHFGRIKDALPLLLRALVLKITTDKAILDVVEDGCAEKSRLLTDEGHLTTQPPQVECTDVDSIQVNSPANRVVEPLDQPDNCTLARSRGTDQRGGLARGDSKADVFHDDDLGPRGINVLDGLELNGSLELLQLGALVVCGIEGRQAVDGGIDLGGGTKSRGKGLHVGRNVAELESANHDGHGDDKKLLQGDFVVDQKLASTPKGQAVVEVQDHHHARHHDGNGALDAETKVLGTHKVIVVLLRKAVLGTKRNGVTDRANDLVGKRSTFGVCVEGLFVVLHDEAGTTSHVQNEGNDGGEQDECEFPVVNEACQPSIRMPVLSCGEDTYQ